MTRTDQNSDSDSLSADSIRRTIAVIDDEHKWLKVFKRMFRNSRYDIDAYDVPQQFLETILKQPDKYAGIICDIQMPQMDGHQVFEAIKSNKATQNIPFVIVSGVLTQNHNLSKIQGVAYISKLDDNLRSRVFQELIEVIENWPKLKAFLKSQNVTEEKIDFFCQFFINYHKYFNEILTYVNRMEVACVNADHDGIARIRDWCNDYMVELQSSCMELIELTQESPEATAFVRKVCERGRTSINMVQTFQLLLDEQPSANAEFRSFLADCRDSLEKIIVGTEKGYNLRFPG